MSYGCGSTLSRSQKIPVAASAAETELVQLTSTVSTASRELEFAKYQQLVPAGEPRALREDSVSATHMATRGKSISHRTRHIKVRYFFVKQLLGSGELTLAHCPTQDMVADTLTN